jgi:DNA-binding response OmpR family regulator
VASLLRRLEGQGATDSFSCAWSYSARRQVLRTPGGKEIPLTHREARFIHILAEQAGSPVRRRDIISRAFEEDPLQYDGRRLDTFVSRLKKKIRSHYCIGEPIKAAHAVGYIFCESICMQ